MSIQKDIKKIIKSDRILFTTPSHDRTNFVIPNYKKLLGQTFLENDLSEINNLDNLSNPESSILCAMKKSAELLGAENVFYLINGSSSGIIASMLAVLKENDKVLISRNCHKSVINGLILSGAEPIWIIPDINMEWGIFNAISPSEIEKKLQESNDIKAVIITSPTYEGINSDIKSIAKICHKYNVILIVDEAHGALKSFYPEFFGENAVKSGADIAVQSLHKTCGAPNPCAILLCGKNINSNDIQNSLNIINTTSPSYPLMSAIEETVSYLCSVKGKKQINNLVNNIYEFKHKFKNTEKIEICNFNDMTKIIVKIDNLSGIELSDILFDKFNIEDELTNNISSVLLTGLGTTKNKLKKLENALKIILSENYQNSIKKTEYPPILIPKMTCSARNAFFAKKENVKIENSIGKICGEIITEYPPGIPILITGEQISPEHIDYLKNKRKIIKVCVDI